MEKKGQPEADAELQRERRVRGKLREGYLEAGRKRAMGEREAHSEAACVPAKQEAALDSIEATEEARAESLNA
jgi:hypothetical protein